MIIRAPGSTPDWGGDVVMQEIPFAAGQILDLGAWVKIESLIHGDVYVELIFASTEAELAKYTSDKIHAAPMDWVYAEVEGMAPKGTVKAKLFLVIGYEPGGYGTVCFDNVDVEAITLP